MVWVLFCQGEWIEGARQGTVFPTMCTCRFVCLHRLVKLAWHYLLLCYLELGAVLGVWAWLFRRELLALADVKAKMSKLQCCFMTPPRLEAIATVVPDTVLVVELDEDTPTVVFVTNLLLQNGEYK